MEPIISPPDDTIRARLPGSVSPLPVSATPPVGSGNPILDEIDRAHQSLSAPAQDAITQAHGILGLPQSTSAPTPAPLANGIKPPVAAGLPAQPAMNPSPARQELSRITAPPLSGPMAHTSADTGRSGVSQIHNPFARVPLQILDAVGRGLFPGIEMGLPGTSGHHDVLVHQQRNTVKGEDEQQAADDAAKTAEATRTHLGAETGELGARAGHEQAQTEVLNNPTKPTNEWLELKDPVIDPSHPELGAQSAFYNKNDPTQGLKYGNASIAAKPAPPKEPKEGELPLGERVPQINDAMTARYQVLHPGAALPAHYMLPKDATQKDFDRTDKLIEGEEKAFGTDQTRKQTEEARKQTAALVAQNHEHKDETALKQIGYKAYTPALDSAERFNVMTKNYEDAIKNHDQQAMLSLLANHLGMTMGLQKGARMTKDIINEAERSRPWLQGLTAKFDKDGYLSGVNLTPEQMRQMVSLGRERFAEDLVKSRNEAKYQGVSDDGPDRTPNKSTINHYIGLANGDAKKAKELATADGWSVK